MKNKQNLKSFTDGIQFSRDMIINLLADLEGREPLLNIMLHGLMSSIRNELNDCVEAAHNDSLMWRGDVINFGFNED